jgi:hypothetical protein
VSFLRWEMYVPVFFVLTSSCKSFGSTAVCVIEIAVTLEIVAYFVTSVRLRSAAFT